VESRLLLAELHIANEDFPEARRALGDMVDKAPDARVLTDMAAIARGEGASDVVVKGWLARALTAPRGPQWVCDKCHNIHAEWVPICENCKGFDTLSWTAPPAGVTSPVAGGEILPRIVGTIEDQSGAYPEEVRDAEILPDEETLHRPIDAAVNEVDVERK
jgi:HemY protein